MFYVDAGVDNLNSNKVYEYWHGLGGFLDHGNYWLG